VRSVHHVRGVVVGHAQQAVETRVCVVRGDTRLGEGGGREPSRAHAQRQRARGHARTSRVHRVRLQTSPSRTPSALGTVPRGGRGRGIALFLSTRGEEAETGFRTRSRTRDTRRLFFAHSRLASFVVRAEPRIDSFSASPPVSRQPLREPSRALDPMSSASALASRPAAAAPLRASVARRARRAATSTRAVAVDPDAANNAVAAPSSEPSSGDAAASLKKRIVALAAALRARAGRHRCAEGGRGVAHRGPHRGQPHFGPRDVREGERRLGVAER